MRITELLKKQSIELGVKAASKEEAIDRLIALMDAGGRLNDRAGYKEGILARESLGSTAIGEGIAIPHAKVEAVKEPGLAAITVPEGVDYEAFDGSLSNLIFMIAAPAGGEDVHLEALSRLSTLLMNPGFKEALDQRRSSWRLSIRRKRSGLGRKKKWMNRKRQQNRKKQAFACWQSLLVPQELPIPIWLLKIWKIQGKNWGFP